MIKLTCFDNMTVALQGYTNLEIKINNVSLFTSISMTKILIHLIWEIYVQLCLYVLLYIIDVTSYHGEVDSWFLQLIEK